MNFNISIDGKERISQILNSYTGKVKDLRPAFDTIAQDIYAEMEKVFDTEGGQNVS